MVVCSFNIFYHWSSFLFFKPTSESTDVNIWTNLTFFFFACWNADSPSACLTMNCTLFVIYFISDAYCNRQLVRQCMYLQTGFWFFLLFCFFKDLLGFYLNDWVTVVCWRPTSWSGIRNRTGEQNEYKSTDFPNNILLFWDQALEIVCILWGHSQTHTNKQEIIVLHCYSTFYSHFIDVVLLIEKYWFGVLFLNTENCFVKNNGFSPPLVHIKILSVKMPHLYDNSSPLIISMPFP